MAAAITRKTPGSRYFALIRAFPLTHIENKAHLTEAQAVLDRLLAKKLDDGEELYLNALTDLVERYEDEHEPISEASEADVLRLLMQSNRLSQSALARNVGMPQSTISAILAGDRSMTKEHMIRLGQFFNVAPEVFFRTG